MIRRRPRVDLDVLAQAEFIARDNPSAARRFLDAVERTLFVLERMPYAGRRHPTRHARLRGLRVRGVNGFPKLLIFYRPIEDGIEVVRLLHAARDLRRALSERKTQGE